jgi:hypothetical protein
MKLLSLVNSLLTNTVNKSNNRLINLEESKNQLIKTKKKKRVRKMKPKTKAKKILILMNLKRSQMTKKNNLIRNKMNNQIKMISLK